MDDRPPATIDNDAHAHAPLSIQQIMDDLDASEADEAAGRTDSGAVLLAKEGRLIEAAELACAELEALKDGHPTDHVDDVMAVCLAMGGAG